jgi:hypothetical protein
MRNFTQIDAGMVLLDKVFQICIWECEANISIGRELAIR